jgi:cytochrome b561
MGRLGAASLPSSGNEDALSGRERSVTGPTQEREMDNSGTRAGAAGEATYSIVARRFHWWTVAFLAVQIPVGLFMVRYGAATEFAEPTGKLYDGHKLLGLTILILAAVRLAYRLVHGAPAEEPTLEPWQQMVSRITHWAIYVMLILVPIIGWRAISHYGPFEPFGIKLPAIAAQNEDLATQAFFYHKVAAYLLIALIGMHVGAALFHYVIRKDGVLRRMWVRAGRLS